jgi:hypothetical protein
MERWLVLGSPKLKEQKNHECSEAFLNVAVLVLVRMIPNISHQLGFYQLSP